MFGNACVYNNKMNPRGCQQSCGSHQGSSMMSQAGPQIQVQPRLEVQDSNPGHRTAATGSATTQDPGLRIQDSGSRTQDLGLRIQDSGCRIQDT